MSQWDRVSVPDDGLSATPREPVPDAERRLVAYITGWKRGTNGAATTQAQNANPDFLAGYEAGRAAGRAACRRAYEIYGAVLSPLREHDLTEDD